MAIYKGRSASFHLQYNTSTLKAQEGDGLSGDVFSGDPALD